jgi:hypothetical protein
LNATRLAKDMPTPTAKIKALKAEVKVMEQAQLQPDAAAKIKPALTRMGLEAEIQTNVESAVADIVEQRQKVLEEHHKARAQHTLKELRSATEALAAVAGGGVQGGSWASTVVDHKTLLAASQVFFDAFDLAIAERLCAKAKRAHETYTKAAAQAQVDATEVEEVVSEAKAALEKTTATMNEAPSETTCFLSSHRARVRRPCVPALSRPP